MSRRTTAMLCALPVMLCLHARAASQAAALPSLPRAHRHIGVSSAGAGQAVPEFSMAEASLAAGAEREQLITSRSRRYEAFTVDASRLFVAERASGKTFEIRGLPLEWRPFSTLTWADERTLMFDRWSQPHYGVHYAVDVEAKRLLAAAPFPDGFYLEQQRPQTSTPAPPSPAPLSCREQPALVGRCFDVRGRLSLYNGAPTVRLWRAGTRRMLGVSASYAREGYVSIPAEIESRLVWDEDLWGDFTVCPFTARRPKVMQLVCIDGAKNVSARKRR